MRASWIPGLIQHLNSGSCLIKPLQFSFSTSSLISSAARSSYMSQASAGWFKRDELTSSRNRDDVSHITLLQRHLQACREAFSSSWQGWRRPRRDAKQSTLKEKHHFKDLCCHNTIINTVV